MQSKKKKKMKRKKYANAYTCMCFRFVTTQSI